MVYSQSELVKFYKAGFIMPLDDLWGLDEIKAATLPVQWEKRRPMTAICWECPTSIRPSRLLR